ncbi:hypothetical protein JG687_00018729 [Phytophthora cactorum]|uniref:Uncharacterized protein n=1 Tax=Phytophthora cactorum TaxID=29920 RepID=A0A8T1TL11_9STRA|nr:hypothetical protein JG687_00018729 [Phytophthora cactorum]
MSSRFCAFITMDMGPLGCYITRPIADINWRRAIVIAVTSNTPSTEVGTSNCFDTVIASSRQIRPLCIIVYTGRSPVVLQK